MSLLTSFTRKAFFLTIVTGFVAMLAMPSAAQADQVTVARNFIQGLGDKAISILSDKSVAKETAAKTFHDMLVNGFDIDLLGKFALGRQPASGGVPGAGMGENIGPQFSG
jgi:ABC-type transporter MlaC component